MRRRFRRRVPASPKFLFVEDNEDTRKFGIAGKKVRHIQSRELVNDVLMTTIFVEGSKEPYTIKHAYITEGA